MEGQNQGISFLSTSSEKGYSGTGPGLYHFEDIGHSGAKLPAATNESLCDSCEDPATANPEVQEAPVGVFDEQSLI